MTPKNLSCTQESDARELRIPAIQITQGRGRQLYSFGIDGKMLARVATISRVRRASREGIQGYQRPEVASHIAEIRRYIESENPMIPNALVVAFDERVTFEGGGRGGGGGPAMGELVIPLDQEEGGAGVPGWIVDGQQRAAAIREARVDGFTMFVTAFITADPEEQRSQFILVNNTKPLPKGLIHELLPATSSGLLPAALERRRFPAQLLERLNYDEDSPLLGLIKTPTNVEGTIKDNSVLRMLENSLRDGALYMHWNPRANGGDVEAMLSILKSFWCAVAEVFPDAWALPPRRSRLVHGVGIVSLGLLMDAITDRFRSQGIPSVAQYAEDLKKLEPSCRWCSGYWEFGPGVQRKWNELQNTSKDIQLLANYLLTVHRQGVWGR